MYGYRYYKFSLSISSEQLLDVYSGSIRRIRVRTDEGLVLDIDADHLRKFTTRSGISGRFQLTTTQDNKFVSLEEISALG